MRYVPPVVRYGPTADGCAGDGTTLATPALAPFSRNSDIMIPRAVSSWGGTRIAPLTAPNVSAAYYLARAARFRWPIGRYAHAADDAISAPQEEHDQS
ncbi:MAG: hypothetical protein HUU46_03485 [Candidatus Hydrogenedentes bacterium]|nr:hypothetical protein [Candidatus Hydrogenedentota bacterium]